MTEEVRALAVVKAGLKARQPLDMLLKDARVWGARQALFKRAVQRIDGDRGKRGAGPRGGHRPDGQGDWDGGRMERVSRLGLSLC